MKPTICQVVFGLDIGGAEVLAKEFAMQTRDTIRTVFACLDKMGALGEELERDGFAVGVLQRRPGFDLRCAWRLARFCRKHQVKLIHAQQYAPFFYAAVGRLMGRPIPILYTEHSIGYPHWHFPRRRRIVANRMLLRRFDRVLAVGGAVCDSVIANLGIPADRVEVVYNGINLAEYQNIGLSRADARAEIGLKEDEIAIIQVARLDSVKDHATAVRTMAELAGKYLNVRLLIVGEGPERSRIESLVAELGLQQQVRLLGVRRDIPRLLHAADIFLLSSVSEGIPLTLIEAMASELPCVSTRVGGVPEIVADGETGLVAEPSNPHCLAGCLEQLIRDSSLRRSMGVAGRARAEELFDERVMHAAYRRIYFQMLGIEEPYQRESHSR